jgi:dTDP-glucose 4,6-dehydratase
MEAAGAKRLVLYTADMVNGHSKLTPQTEDHPRVPVGRFGQSKRGPQTLADEYRVGGFNISMFRPARTNDPP